MELSSLQERVLCKCPTGPGPDKGEGVMSSAEQEPQKKKKVGRNIRIQGMSRVDEEVTAKRRQ